MHAQVYEAVSYSDICYNTKRIKLINGDKLNASFISTYTLSLSLAHNQEKVFGNCDMSEEHILNISTHSLKYTCI